MKIKCIIFFLLGMATLVFSTEYHQRLAFNGSQYIDDDRGVRLHAVFIDDREQHAEYICFYTTTTMSCVTGRK